MKGNTKENTLSRCKILHRYFAIYSEKNYCVFMSQLMHENSRSAFAKFVVYDVMNAVFENALRFCF